MFAYEHDADAVPDVLIIGKALGGGVYPVSAVLSSREIMDVIRPGDHGSTFGGNPLAAAVAGAALAVIVDEALPERAQMLGARLADGIHAIEATTLEAVRGKGLLLGLQIRQDRGTARDLALRLLARGVLAKDTHRQVLRLAPPLVVSVDEVDWLIEQLDRVLS
jgi:ornithine--oxo-acid transaminase